MIVVLLLFFKSICLYCQRIVLHIHDRWINPKNTRILREAAEITGDRTLLENTKNNSKRLRKRSSASGAAAASDQAGLSPFENSSCRFCLNSPQGYCRHHFHLQELQIKKQRETIWKPLSGNILKSPFDYDPIKEYKELRKIKKELKRNLQSRQPQPQQFHFAQHQQQQNFDIKNNNNKCNQEGQSFLNICDKETLSETSSRIPNTIQSAETNSLTTTTNASATASATKAFDSTAAVKVEDSSTSDSLEGASVETSDSDSFSKNYSETTYYFTFDSPETSNSRSTAQTPLITTFL